MSVKLLCDALFQKQAKHLLEEALEFQTKRFNFAMSKLYKIKPWIYKITCKNCARRTTCNGCIMKCRDNHNSQKLGTQKEHMSSKIENKKNEIQKQRGATWTKIEKLHMWKEHRSCIIKNKKMKVRNKEELHEQSSKELHMQKKHRRVLYNWK